MRHDTHFIASSASGGSGGPMCHLELTRTRTSRVSRWGDLSELTPRFARRASSSRSWSAASTGRYQIIAGERRYRAAREAGLAELPCVVREGDDAETMELALIENLQRRDLSPSKRRTA